MTENNLLLVRGLLLADGYTRSAIQHRVDSGQWSRVFRGLYLADEPDPHVAMIGRHAVVLARGGASAALSHDTAAIHHGFDSTQGFDSLSTYVTVDHATQSFRLGGSGASQFPLVVKRTRHLPPAETLVVDEFGRRFTGRVRTLLDLASRLSLHEFAVALESGLRGPDPKRPDCWRKGVLEELVAMVKARPRQPGAIAARIVLTQRTWTRPTGSIADTAVLLALKAAGVVDVVVQPRIIAPDHRGQVRVHFADLLIPSGQLIIEIDGAFHDLPGRRKLDFERDRRLTPGFHLFRYPASVALFETQRIVAEVRAHLGASVDAGQQWQTRDRRVEGSDDNWSITRC